MEADDSWFTVEQIDHTTYAISEYGHWEKVNSYLLVGEHRAVLIDTGTGIGNIKELVEQITDLPVSVITTHVHWDHIGCHTYFDDIFVHEYEKSWLADGIPGLSIEQIRHDVGRDITKPLPDGFDLQNYQLYRGKPTHAVKDGDTLAIGNRTLTFLHTPGHSPGHLCIYEEDRGYLFTGDLLYKGTLYAFYPSTDPQQFVQSIERISQLHKIHKIMPGHHDTVLDRRFLSKVRGACRALLAAGEARHGTGVHAYDEFSIHF